MRARRGAVRDARLLDIERQIDPHHPGALRLARIAAGQPLERSEQRVERQTLGLQLQRFHALPERGRAVRRDRAHIALQAPPQRAQRFDRHRTPGPRMLIQRRDGLTARANPVPPQEAAEQQHGHVEPVLVLQRQGRVLDPVSPVQIDREAPESRRVGRRLGRLLGPPHDRRDPMDELQEREIRARIDALLSEHRDLDDMIARVSERAPFDQLQMQRMKKRKLAIKDQIARLETMLIDDIIA
eukprot:g512.t1